MNFRRLVAVLQAHSKLKLPLDYEIARLIRVKEEATWRAYDVPTYLRRPLRREPHRNLPAFLRKQA
jgi:hypothetical protein